MRTTLYVVAQWTLAKGANEQSVEFVTARTYIEAANRYCRNQHLATGTLELADFNDIAGHHIMRYDIHNRYLY
jgi:hypothetical protein